LNAQVQTDVAELLQQPKSFLGTIGDYFGAFMINKRAKHYGVEPVPGAFSAHFMEVAEKEWISGFEVDKFALKG